MNKELTIVSPKIANLGSITLFTKKQEEKSVQGEDDNIFILFKGLVILGIPYGVMYWKPVNKNMKLKAVKNTTMLGNMPDLLSVTENSGILPKSKFEAVCRDPKFENVVILAM
jgi:hypothetical protein